MKRKGVRHYFTTEQILAYQHLSLKQKLAWLQAANEFSYKMLKGERKKIWEKFRRGKI